LLIASFCFLLLSFATCQGNRIVWSGVPETEKVEARCDFDVVAADEQSSAKVQEFKAYTQKIHNTDVSFEMVAISGGEFTMGSPAGEAGRNEDEGPQHRVRVQSFWMGKCEVTWDEFELWSQHTRLQPAQRKSTDRTPLDIKADAITRPTLPYADLSNGMGTHGCPAICISQHAAKKYCEWLSAQTDHYYRLPTEAEWEYACRAGTTTAYSFGDDPTLLNEYAWYDVNGEVDAEKKYHPVGLKKPNPWGLHDMHGNVAEWVQDKYEADFYKASPANQVAESPLCIARREYPRVTRGGSWMSQPSLTRSAARQPSTEKWKESDPQFPKSAWYVTDAPFVGFRVLRPLRTPTLDERKNQRLDAAVPTDVVEGRLPGH
jgi:formylglycine-generating enzyme required for sulfatase activity